MGVSYPDRASIRFGAFELDLQAGVLRKNGIRIRCQEQPLQVLAALAERPGELVTREELRRRVWPGDTFVDFDHALNTAIKKIRAALNDDADSPRYIETVPRRGYRLMAPVEQELASPSPLRHRSEQSIVACCRSPLSPLSSWQFLGLRGRWLPGMATPPHLRNSSG